MAISDQIQLLGTMMLRLKPRFINLYVCFEGCTIPKLLPLVEKDKKRLKETESMWEPTRGSSGG